MKTDDTQPPNDCDVNRLQGIPDLKVELRPVPDAPGQHLLFVGGQQIGVSGDTDPRDNDDAPNPIEDWVPDNDDSHPNEELIRLGKAFVDRHQGVLTEGQMVSLTGLDRVTVRDVEDLFNQAMSCLADGLALMKPKVKP